MENESTLKLLLLTLLLSVNVGHHSHAPSESHKDTSYSSYSSIDVIHPDNEEEDPGTLS
jgi:hypothetical protein